MTTLSACTREALSARKLHTDNQIEWDAVKEALRSFDPYNKDPDQIVSGLRDILPKDLEDLRCQELVDIIFQGEYADEMIAVLTAFSQLNPSFILSPYNQIRKTIAQDQEFQLTNSWLATQALSDDEQNACYDLAYRLDHPYLYRRAQSGVPQYILNFLWVNLNPQDRTQDVAQNIFGDGLNLSENEECLKEPETLRAFEKAESFLSGEELEKWLNIKKSFMYRLSKWADTQPAKTEINLWYDSALVTQKAQQNTFKLMEGIAKSRRIKLALRDVRQLLNVPFWMKKSFHPATPVYYRVDIFKALIADHLMSSPEDKAKYCVVSDIDVEPMPPEQMFDQRTEDYLFRFGYVFNRAGMVAHFENSFFIFNREKEGIQAVHRKAVIEAVEKHIDRLSRGLRNATIKSECRLNHAYVFNRYGDFRQATEEGKRGEQPRKVVKAPQSQFLGGLWEMDDHRSETFRFENKKDSAPYTRGGRNGGARDEIQIPSLKSWKAEPLEPCEI